MRLPSKRARRRIALHAHEFGHPTALAGREDVALVCNGITRQKLATLLRDREDGVVRFFLRRIGRHIAILVFNCAKLRIPIRRLMRLSPHAKDMAG